MSDSAVWTPARHPLARYLQKIAGGSFPPVDGGWTRVSPWSQHVQAILSVTGHAILAVSYDISDNALADLGVNGTGGAHDARIVSSLAGERGWVDSLDVLFLGVGTGGSTGSSALVSRSDLGKDPLVEHARRIRTDVQVMGHANREQQDVVVLSHGVAGLREISFSLAPARRGQGEGAALVREALNAVPENELVVACVAPGNAASMRACLAAGLTPAGSIQLFSDRPERRAA